LLLLGWLLARKQPVNAVEQNTKPEESTENLMVLRAQQG
jgi:hypothetical protein